MNPASPAHPCPCGSGFAYGDCCGRWHAGAAASDPVSLMRSRYCAFVLADAAYLLATWHPTTRPATLDFGDAANTRWLGLDVRSHRRPDDAHAVVEFVARSRVGGGRAVRHHETSRFVLEAGRWFYVDGDVLIR